MHWLPTTPLIAALLAAALLAPAAAWSEKADRDKPMVVEADKPGSIDLQRQVVIFNGNVVISQGTMVIRADSVEIQEAPGGSRTAVAIGSPGRQASYRQKRDAVDESVEGMADRIEFDSGSGVLQLTGNAAVRRLRGTTTADEITGGSITWDNNAELFSVKGGATSPSNPSGRVRAVLSPRQQGAASAPTGAASAALKPSRALGEPR